MKTFKRKESSKEFEKFWSELEKDWFKVEVLQDYSGEDNSLSLQTWLNGDKNKSLQLIRESMKDSEWIKSSQNNKFKKIRLHIVEEPYSQYLLWEIEHYKLVNIPLLGEEIFLVRKEDVKDLVIPDGDFMIFDDKRVARNHYTSDGRMYNVDFYYEEDDITTFLDFKKALMEKASKLLINQGFKFVQYY